MDRVTKDRMVAAIFAVAFLLLLGFLVNAGWLDPIIGKIADIYLWYRGIKSTAGFGLLLILALIGVLIWIYKKLRK